MGETRWLTSEEQAAWRAFMAGCRALFTAVDTQLQKDAGMPLAYYEILVRLSEAPGRALRMSQLAEAASASWLIRSARPGASDSRTRIS